MNFLKHTVIIYCLFNIYVSTEAKPNNNDIAHKFEGVTPANLVTIDKDTYYISSDFEMTNAADARILCNNQRMKLVSFDKEDKWSVISEYLQTHTGFGDKAYWTSGQKVDNTWMWTEINKEFSFTDWDVVLGEPDETASEICVYIFPGSGWYDMNCNLQYNFICEF